MTLKIFVHDYDVVAYFYENTFTDLHAEYNGRATVKGFRGTNFTHTDMLDMELEVAGMNNVFPSPEEKEDREKIFSRLSEDLFSRIAAGEFAQEMWEHRVRSAKKELNYNAGMAKELEEQVEVHRTIQTEYEYLICELKSSTYRNPEYEVDALPDYL